MINSVIIIVPVLAGTFICALDIPLGRAALFYHLTFKAWCTRKANGRIFISGKWNSFGACQTLHHGIRRQQFRTPTFRWETLSFWASSACYTLLWAIFLFNPVFGWFARICLAWRRLGKRKRIKKSNNKWVAVLSILTVRKITTQNICILCRNGGESIKTRKKLARLSFAILSNSRLIF